MNGRLIAGRPVDVRMDRSGSIAARRVAPPLPVVVGAETTPEA
jgi:hypothetical protein